MLDSDKILVLASDGVWEFLSNKEVIEMIAPYYERNSPSGACERVMRESVQRWKREDEVIDDITVVIAFLGGGHKRERAFSNDPQKQQQSVYGYYGRKAISPSPMSHGVVTSFK